MQGKANIVYPRQEELLFKQIYIIHCNLFLEKEVKNFLTNYQPLETWIFIDNFKNSFLYLEKIQILSND